MELGTLRLLAASLLLPDHRASEGENRSWSANLLHLAAKVLLKDLDWPDRPLAPQLASGACLHDDPVLLRPADNASMSTLVPEQVGVGQLPAFHLRLEHLQWRDLLHRRLRKAIPEGAGSYESRNAEVAEQS